jgi:hypothetical protein
MVGLSSHGETTVLASILTTVFVSLHTTDPGDTGAAEIAGNAYARTAATFTDTGANPTTASNSAIVSFPTATAGWGTIAYFGLWSAATSGNYQGSGQLDVSRIVNAGDKVQFLTGALTVSAN